MAGKWRENMTTAARTILVPDADEIQKLASSLPVLTVGFNEGSKYVPVLTTGSHQLILLRDGRPIMSYRVASAGSDSTLEPGMHAILGYVGTLSGNKHLVMLYDDPELARKVEFLYLKQGLEKWHELCLYLLPSDDVETIESIREQMDRFGIDTRRYLKDGSLRIEKISDPTKDGEGFIAGCEKIFDSLRKQVSRPSRVVLHVKYKFGTDEEIRDHAEFESEIQSSISRFNGSVLCNHYVGDNNEVKYSEWTKRMFRTHDNVFLVSRSKKHMRGVGFEPTNP